MRVFSLFLTKNEFVNVYLLNNFIDELSIWSFSQCNNQADERALVIPKCAVAL